ncbi:carboxylating nicotinate-nucleotide diphosphorylase [Methanobrevibacter filiformis]|uniref:Nicotinate-nucleotide pyrophosphorylase [carboxylating] n=1 Tax=Methanobrevibacter filiformis TaxID=55758 RepID=A0A166AH24_9EURY|nr:carboxylating nicotinate-nucleotide diphosphorylase [Methanobrevibacter filiformis]KZX12023.1 putative nicotinate-nucleotide pyrophosphorylase [Methanobrevibacter filiformis]
MKKIIKYAIEEDVGFGDITSNILIPKNKIVKGQIIAKSKGMMAGVEIARKIFEEHNIKTNILKKDGETIVPHDTILEIEGTGQNILKLERTVLNIIMRMSGIATITHNLLKKIRKVNKDIKIAGTRKTLPGFQEFDKLAIFIGGGDTHRLRLDDQVLIKDNHIAITGSVSEAVKQCKKQVSFTKKIEVEVESLHDAIDAAKSKADIIMLDNRSPKEIMDIINELSYLNLRKNVIIEISGGINEENILEYAKTPADVISLGFITHSVNSLDFSLEINIK